MNPSFVLISLSVGGKRREKPLDSALRFLRMGGGTTRRGPRKQGHALRHSQPASSLLSPGPCADKERSVPCTVMGGPVDLKSQD